MTERNEVKLATWDDMDRFTVDEPEMFSVDELERLTLPQILDVVESSGRSFGD